MAELKTVSLKKIKVGKRYRKDYGDIEKLAASIEEIGLLHPVVLMRGNRLVVGARRLKAYESLGRKTIQAFVARDFDEAHRLAAETDENVCRKDYSPSEAVVLARALRPVVEAAAKARQGTRTDLDGEHMGKLSTSKKDRVRDQLASAVGFSGSTLEKAEAVVAAAEEEPECFGAIVEEMDRTGKVDPAFKGMKRVRKRAKAIAQGRGVLEKADARIICLDIEEAAKEIDAGSIDAIVTDPPYPREFLPLYDILAREAARLLRPGGSLFAMSGQSYLPAIYTSLLRSLRYQWTLAYMTPGQKTQIMQRKIHAAWKPVLWFVNGEYDGDWFGTDVVVSEKPDKRFDAWGQSESGMAALIERYTKPSDLILDPFCGQGTTGVVCVRLGRRFIGIDIDEKAVLRARARIDEERKRCNE